MWCGKGEAGRLSNFGLLAGFLILATLKALIGPFTVWGSWLSRYLSTNRVLIIIVRTRPTATFQGWIMACVFQKFRSRWSPLFCRSCISSYILITTRRSPTVIPETSNTMEQTEDERGLERFRQQWQDELAGKPKRTEDKPKRTPNSDPASEIPLITVRNSGNQSAAITNPFFGQLATETVPKIASYLDVPGIIALHSQDHLLHKRTHLIFIAKIYTTRHVHRTKSSMENLYKFSLFSSPFKSLVQTLKIDSLDCTQSTSVKVRKGRRRGYKTSTEFGKNPCSDPGFAREGKIYGRKFVTMARVLEEIAMSCNPGNGGKFVC